MKYPGDLTMAQHDARGKAAGLPPREDKTLQNTQNLEISGIDRVVLSTMFIGSNVPPGEALWRAARATGNSPKLRAGTRNSEAAACGVQTRGSDPAFP